MTDYIQSAELKQAIEIAGLPDRATRHVDGTYGWGRGGKRHLPLEFASDLLATHFLRWLDERWETAVNGPGKYDLDWSVGLYRDGIKVEDMDFDATTLIEALTKAVIGSQQ